MPNFNDFDLDIQTNTSSLPTTNITFVISSTTGIHEPCYITNESCECPYTYDIRCIQD